MNKNILSLLLCLSLSPALSARENAFDNEEQIRQFLLQKSFKIDTTAAAVYLATSGKVVASYSESRFYFDYTVEKMVKIMDDRGKDVTEVTIDLPAGQSISGVSTKVYHLSGRRVVGKEITKPMLLTETEGSKKAVLRFGNAGTGDIIYYTYTLRVSDQMLIPAWYIQESYPNLHSSFTMSNEWGLEYLVYNNKGISFAQAVTGELSTCTACVFSNANREVEGTYRTREWARNNIPAAGSAMGNALEPRELMQPQLRYYQSQQHAPSKVTPIGYTLTDEHSRYEKDLTLNTWEDVNRFLLYGSKNFGGRLGRKSKAIDAQVATLTAGAADVREKALHIYNFVRDNIQLTSDEVLGARRDPEDVLKDAKGSLCEKNFLLTDMLRKAGLQADPVLLSRGADDNFTMDVANYGAMNYCLTLLTEDDKKYYLDPSMAAMSFGALLPGCYGKTGYVVNKAGGFALLPEAPKGRTAVTANVRTEENATYSPVQVEADLSPLASLQFRYDFMKSGRKVTDAELAQFAASYFGYGWDSLASCSVSRFQAMDTTIRLVYNGLVKTSSILEGNFSPYVLPVVEQSYKTGTGGVQKVVYSLEMSLPAGYTVKYPPAPKNMRYGDNQIAYSSNAAYDAGAHMLRLSYSMQEGGKKITGQPAELNTFLSGIRNSQRAALQINKSSL